MLTYALYKHTYRRTDRHAYIYIHTYVDTHTHTHTYMWESPKERDHLKDQGVDGRMGSKWTLVRFAGGVWSGFTWLRIGTVDGLL
jgi:hypothetical protein